MASSAIGPKLGDVVTLVRGTTYKGALLGQPGPVLLGLASIQRHGGFRADSLKTYGGECKAKLLLWPGDLYASLKDVTQSAELLGAVARVPTFIASGRLTQDTVKLEFVDEGYPRELLYWSLRSPTYRSYCREHATGTTTLGLARDDFLAFPLPVPTRHAMDLVELLEAIEARIQGLRETNTTLEAIAQALFKSWFVDFDPVRAKAEGREPDGMDAVTAALFPGEFEESGLGLIPEGWWTGTFGDIASQSKGSVSPLSSRETEYDHYSLPAFDAGLMPVLEFGEAIKSNKTPVPNGAVLISKLNPHIPRIWFTGEVRRNAVCSTEFLVWVPLDGISAEYVFCLATSAPFNTAMRQLVTGTSNSHQRVKPDYLTAIAAVVPPSDVTTEFGKISGPLLRRVLENRSIALSLAQLRDTLLPRLVSGKLRLPDADAMIEEAVT